MDSRSCAALVTYVDASLDQRSPNIWAEAHFAALRLVKRRLSRTCKRGQPRRTASEHYARDAWPPREDDSAFGDKHAFRKTAASLFSRRRVSLVQMEHCIQAANVKYYLHPSVVKQEINGKGPWEDRTPGEY